MHEHSHCAQNSSPQQHSGYTYSALNHDPTPIADLKLYPYQRDAVDAVRFSVMRKKRRPMLMAPTGAGKTIMATQIIKNARQKDKTAILTVPALELVDQTIQKLYLYGIRDVGVIQSDHFLTNPSAPVQVASIQTLLRRNPEVFPKADLVLIDEAHRWFKFYGEWMNWPEWQRVPFVGLSATPWTKGLGQFYDDLVISTTTQKLIDQGFLAPFRVYAPPAESKPNLSKIRMVNTKYGRDYDEEQLSKEMRRPKLVADVVKTWLEKGENRQTFCFAVDRAHAQELVSEFKQAGVSVAYMDGNTLDDERAAIRESFQNKEITVVCNVGVLTTGIDWDVRCIILARPTKSEILYCQIIGRGLRTAPGKDACLILDHSDTTARLGFVTDIHHEYLDDGTPKTSEAKKREKEEREERLPEECQWCGYFKRKGAGRCPDCGKGGRRSKVDVVEGDLVEVRPGKIDTKLEANNRQLWYSQLLWIQDRRRYKDKWAFANFCERFGDAPRGLSAIRMPPGQEVLNYVKGRLIRRAYSRYNPQRRMAV